MDFLNRFFGTLIDPGKTFRAITDKPVWLDILIFILILIVVFNYLVFPFIQKDSLKLMEDNAVRLKERLGEERYNAALQRTKSGSRILSAAVIIPIGYLILFLFSSLIVLGLGRLTSTQGSYLQVFSLMLHANLADKFLGNGLRLFLILTRRSVLETSTGLAVFFPKLEVTSTAYLILSQVDFFQLWMFGIFGLGLSYAFKVDIKKGLFISYLFWILKAVLTIALGMLRLRLFQ